LEKIGSRQSRLPLRAQAGARLSLSHRRLLAEPRPVMPQILPLPPFIVVKSFR
jgi:hypothetical protein